MSSPAPKVENKKVEEVYDDNVDDGEFLNFDKIMLK